LGPASRGGNFLVSSYDERMSNVLVEPTGSPYLVPFDGSFLVEAASTTPPPGEADKKRNKRALERAIKRLRELQRKLYAHDRYAVLLVFQAMDAAGKDGTIRAVMTGINPAGCQVYSFKQPSAEELDHDFLWRIYRRLPERGRIGIFNRSHYEEVLVVRVHPEHLDAQRLPNVAPARIWDERLASIRDFEAHLARNGTVILKFWLHVSRDEQRKRFLARIDDPERHWKFAPADVRERGHWEAYMHAYDAALNQTSRPHAPWYAIPADDKPYMRRVVAETLCDTLERLEMSYPQVSKDDRAEMLALRDQLLRE
jgi:PPK2 family polyphosphate:nucleotide phosphotransferase